MPMKASLQITVVRTNPATCSTMGTLWKATSNLMKIMKAIIEHTRIGTVGNSD